LFYKINRRIGDNYHRVITRRKMDGNKGKF